MLLKETFDSYRSTGIIYAFTVILRELDKK